MIEWTLMVAKLSVWITTSTWHGMAWLAELNKQMDRSILLECVTKCVLEAFERFVYVDCDFLLSPSSCRHHHLIY